MKRFLAMLMMLLIFPCTSTGQDPLSILEQLPPPEVIYETAPVNSYPQRELSLEDKDQWPTPSESAPKETPRIDPKKIVEETIPDSFKSLANLVKTIARPQATATAKIDRVASEPADVKGPIKAADLRIPGKVRVIQQKTKVLESFNTLKNNQLLSEIQGSYEQNLQLFLETIEQSQKFAANKSVSEEEETPEEVGAEDGDEKSFDAVFTKIKGLQKDGKWKEIIDLLSENPEAEKSKEGLEAIIDAQLNLPKPNTMAARRAGTSLLELDPKSSWGNYALAVYYYNAKKPNTTKASKHLELALNAKPTHPGASKLYWMQLLKKLWIVFILLIGAAVGGINHLVKKKKAAAAAAAILAGDEPGSEGEPEKVAAIQPAEDEPKTGLAAKLQPFLQKIDPILSKLRPLIDKIRKKKGSDVTSVSDSETGVQAVAPNTAQPANGASTPAEVQATEAKVAAVEAQVAAEDTATAEAQKPAAQAQQVVQSPPEEEYKPTAEQAYEDEAQAAFQAALKNASEEPEEDGNDFEEGEEEAEAGAETEAEAVEEAEAGAETEVEAVEEAETGAETEAEAEAEAKPESGSEEETEPAALREEKDSADDGPETDMATDETDPGTEENS